MRKFVDQLIAWGPSGLFVLALLDSAGVPLPGGVDALLLTISVVHPSAAWEAAIAAVLGSTLGSWGLYGLARHGGRAYLDKHTRDGRGARLKQWFLRYGLVTVFIPALLPIPLPMKVPVLCAGAFRVPRVQFLPVILAARIPRYFGLAWLGMQLGTDAAGWLKRHALHIGGFAIGLAALLFLLLRLFRRDVPIAEDTVSPPVAPPTGGR